MEHGTGYVGKLSHDQEFRLQQLWMFLLGAFDYSAPDGQSYSVDEAVPVSPRSFDSSFVSHGRSSSGSGSMSSINSNPIYRSPTTDGLARRSTGNKLRRKDSQVQHTPQSPRFTGAKRSLSFHAQSMSGLLHPRLSPQNTTVMQRVLAAYGITADELRHGLLSSLKHDHPDAMLLRFLRARKWDVGKAFVLLVSSMAWRVKKMCVDDDIAPRGELYALQQSRSQEPIERRFGADFMRQLRMGKNIIHGVDRAGRPIVDIRVRLHHAEDQAPEVIERYVVHTIESVGMLLRPPVIETATVIFDLTDFTMANMDYTPVKYIIKCLEHYYPECLGLLLIHKAPWFFSGIWKVIKTWMNDSLVSKVHFTKTVADLNRFVSSDNLPADLSGSHAQGSYAYRYIEPDATDKTETLSTDLYCPTRDFLQSQRARLAEELLDATRLWLQTGTRRDRIGLAIQQDRRRDVIEKLRVNYWRLDPFVRARTQLDREGVIVGDGVGTIDFFPWWSSSEKMDLDDDDDDELLLPDVQYLATDDGKEHHHNDDHDHDHEDEDRHDDDDEEFFLDDDEEIEIHDAIKVGQVELFDRAAVRVVDVR